MADTNRIEATIPKPRFEQVQELEKLLGCNKSQIVDEALALFFKAVVERKKGRRVAFVDSEEHLQEFTSPSLAQVEWAASMPREKISLSGDDFDRFAAAVEKPSEPTPALVSAMRRHKRR